MHRFLYLLCLLKIQILSFAQFYPANQIADSLRINSNAVLRENLYEYVYYSHDKNISRHKKVITVLNKNGDDQAVLSLPYNRFLLIKSLKGAIYNESGLQIAALKMSDIADFSGSAGYALFSDLRYKYYRPLMSSYPYTVVYEFELEYAGSNNFPDFFFFEDYNVSLESSVFRIQVPDGYRLNWKKLNNCGDPAITKKDEMMEYEWRMNGIPALSREPFEDQLVNQVKAVLTAPSDFSLAGYPGRMNSWDDYARWIGDLNEGRDFLPENRVGEIRELVKNETDDVAKIRILYDFLQQHTRYFNISFGIGSLQPVEAQTVDQVGYGDCKGLSNYMKALLKAIHINSYYVVVEAGDDFPQMIQDFPTHQFNHAILCVPVNDDTIWLECTNQRIPFGFLSSFTSDRTALLINENGGGLVRTPAYNLQQNYQNTKCKIELTADCNGMAYFNRNFGGLLFGQFMPNLYSSFNDQQEWLLNYFNIPNYKLLNFKFNCPDKGKPASELTAEIEIQGYCSSTGKRLFLPLNQMNMITSAPSDLKTRRSDIRCNVPFIHSDTIEYILPDGITVEYLPESTEIRSPFGEYKVNIHQTGNRLFYCRELRVFKGLFPGSLYTQFVKFYYDISVADKCQAVLFKNNF